MALKNWRKVTEGVDNIVFRSKKIDGGGRNTLISITEESGSWRVLKYKIDKDKTVGVQFIKELRRGIKDKSKAMKFAKRYMRSH